MLLYLPSLLLLFAFLSHLRLPPDFTLLLPPLSDLALDNAAGPAYDNCFIPVTFITFIPVPLRLASIFNLLLLFRRPPPHPPPPHTTVTAHHLNHRDFSCSLHCHSALLYLLLSPSGEVGPQQPCAGFTPCPVRQSIIVWVRSLIFRPCSLAPFLLVNSSII